MRRNKIKFLFLTVLAACFSFSFININAMEYYSKSMVQENIKKNIFKHFSGKKIYDYDIIQNYLRYKKTGEIVEVKQEDKEQKIPITKKQFKILLYGMKDRDPLDFRSQYNVFCELERPYSKVVVDFDLIKKIMEELIEEKKTEIEKLKTFYLCFEELFEIFEKNFLEIFKKNNLYKRAPEEYGGDIEQNQLKYGARNKDEEKLFIELGIVRTPMFAFLYEQYEYCKYFRDFVYMFLRDKYSFYREFNGQVELGIDCLHRLLIFDIDKVNSYLGMRITTMLRCLELMDSMYVKFLDFTKNMKDRSLLNLKFAEKILFKKNIGEKKKNIFGKDSYTSSFEVERENFLEEDVKGMEEFFNPSQTIEELTSYLKDILGSLNLSKEKLDVISHYYLDFIEKYNKKIIINSSVLNNIKKGIELRKEIMPVIEKITQKEVYENIISTIISFIDEEPKIIKKFYEKFVEK